MISLPQTSYTATGGQRCRSQAPVPYQLQTREAANGTAARSQTPWRWPLELQASVADDHRHGTTRTVHGLPAARLEVSDRTGSASFGGMRKRSIAALLLTSALLVGCSSDGSDGDVETEIGNAATVVSSSTAPATTETPVTTTTPPPVGAPTAEAASRTLYDAWTRDDRAAAAAVAEQDAIDVMWSATPGPYELYSGCDDGEFDTGGCMFRDRSTNNTIQITLEKRDGQWVAITGFFSEG